MSKELTKAEQEEALAEFRASTAKFDGDNTLALGRAAMCFGTPEEEQMYGPVGAKRGVLIDVLEKRELKTTQIVPLCGWEDRCFWEKGARFPVYVYRFKDYHKIPRGHIGWGDDGKGGSIPEIAAKRYNWVVMVEGEPLPYLMTFKRTAAGAGRFILETESRRQIRGLGSPAYNLKLIDDKNSEDKAYKRLVAEVAGECPPAMIPVVNACRKQLAHLIQEGVKMASEQPAPESHDEDVPF